MVETSTMSTLAPNALPDFLLSRGRNTFSLAEARSLLQRSDDAVRKGLERLTRSGQIFSPSRGFYVVIPPEFRSWGTVPASHFIDDLMRALDRRYYVALLSAAELHGAAHQAPQVFQVMVDRHVKDRDFGRTRLRFYTSRHVIGSTVERHNVPTGQLRLAPRELTAVDLVEHPSASGGIDNVATVLAELTPLDGHRLASLAARRERSTARRLGWLLALVDADLDLEPLQAVAEPRHGSATDLRVGAPRLGHVDRAWNVRVNIRVEPDL
jgi:predicted transcriptional regulator of viral defense system